MINRIILIGNGFDLAHGMKTSYRDFIDKYWNDKCEAYEKNEHSLFECDEFSLHAKI
ncbi:AbiH family protein [Chryseobacterium aureum]|uniref:AbiH family protein n=1 Tax=Chryseobacterium aureum TaxID=2497456 RepID=UPI00374448FC